MADNVDTLLDAFKKLKRASKDDEGKTKKTGLIYSVVAGVIAVTIIGLLSFRLWRQGKKIVKLQHEKDVNDELAIQSEKEAILAKNEQERITSQNKVFEIKEKIKEIDENMAEAKENYAQAKEIIHEVKTWDDYDNTFG